ncbi:MAG: type II toxin-antitoxin system VapB family antitoxin [Blastochloris sp.]|nr:type II toxin-antitoxin system VapB family antitoxin [Blastochloris sp.]
MRTTLNIDEHLLHELKAIALAKQQTLGQVVEEALRIAYLKRPKTKLEQQPRPLKTFGGDGVMPGVDLASSNALLECMENG